MGLAGGGKLGRWGTVATVAPSAQQSAQPGRLFFVADQVSGKKLLVDTGSAFSIFPHKSASKPFGLLLKAANRQRIRCWGSRCRSLKLSGLPVSVAVCTSRSEFPNIGH
jgi:hypothetical protein